MIVLLFNAREQDPAFRRYTIAESRHPSTFYSQYINDPENPVSISKAPHSSITKFRRILTSVSTTTQMSVSYPEGETFFTRAGLATSQSDGYHAENAQHFHSHIMIEYIWNREADHGSVNANSPKGHWHLRSGYNISKGSNWGTHYGNYTQLPFSYGTGNPNIIFRRYEHNLCTSGNRFKAFEKGGSAEVRARERYYDRRVETNMLCIGLVHDNAYAQQERKMGLD